MHEHQLPSTPRHRGLRILLGAVVAAVALSVPPFIVAAAVQDTRNQQNLETCRRADVSGAYLRRGEVLPPKLHVPRVAATTRTIFPILACADAEEPQLNDAETRAYIWLVVKVHCLPIIHHGAIIRCVDFPAAARSLDSAVRP